MIDRLLGIIGIAETLLLKLDGITGLPASPLDANVEAEKSNYRAAPREGLDKMMDNSSVETWRDSIGMLANAKHHSPNIHHSPQFCDSCTSTPRIRTHANATCSAL